jgi:Lrp/AsnC family transcriptional regulator for asnA, asnC and gidA
VRARVASDAPLSQALQADPTLSDFELAIIRALQEDGRRSYRQMAFELDTTGKHVRSAVRRLLDSGVMEVTAVTFPPLLGYRGMANVAVRVQPNQALREVAAALADIKAVDYLAITTGSYDLFADVVCRDRSELLQTLDQQIRPVPGVASAEAFAYLSFPYQGSRGVSPLVAPEQTARTPINLTETDRQIVAELTNDGRTSYKAIAGKLNISEAQVRQRMKRLTEKGAVRIAAIVNPSTLGFDTMAWVGIRTGSARLADTVRMVTELGSSTWVATVAGKYELFAELLCVDEQELSDELDRIRTSKLVTSAEPFVYLDLHYKRLSLL